jgi:hypothetical protein
MLIYLRNKFIHLPTIECTVYNTMAVHKSGFNYTIHKKSQSVAGFVPKDFSLNFVVGKKYFINYRHAFFHKAILWKTREE